MGEKSRTMTQNRRSRRRSVSPHRRNVVLPGSSFVESDIERSTRLSTSLDTGIDQIGGRSGRRTMTPQEEAIRFGWQKWVDWREDLNVYLVRCLVAGQRPNNKKIPIEKALASFVKKHSGYEDHRPPQGQQPRLGAEIYIMFGLPRLRPASGTVSNAGTLSSTLRAGANRTMDSFYGTMRH